VSPLVAELGATAYRSDIAENRARRRRFAALGDGTALDFMACPSTSPEAVRAFAARGLAPTSSA
jgi:hypothetical protein